MKKTVYELLFKENVSLLSLFSPEKNLKIFAEMKVLENWAGTLVSVWNLFG